MTPKRPKSLKWIGAELPDGRPERYLEFVPARDLTEDETDALTQDQLAVIRHHSDLYKEVHAPEPKKEPATAKVASAKAKVAQPESRPDGAETTIGADTGDEPTAAAEPATEGEAE